VDDIVNQTVNRVLDLVDVTLPEDLFRRWQGGRTAQEGSREVGSCG
jgi:4-hydroxy-3-polyprenylbenzoate decarboxylase